MKTLPLVKIWTGDGLGAAYAATLTQLKRTDKVALYKRQQKDGTPQGYEVFMVKVIEAGTPMPGGGAVEESYEQYPTANRFGKIAWAPWNRAYAEEVFDNLTKGIKPGDAEEDDEGESDIPTVAAVERLPGQRGRTKGARPQLTVPTGEFSLTELAESNKVDYPVAYTFVKEALVAGTIKMTRTERRAGSKRPTNIYAKI